MTGSNGVGVGVGVGVGDGDGAGDGVLSNRVDDGSGAVVNVGNDWWECAICYDVLLRPTRLSCGHVTCEGCFQENLDSVASRCPFCRKRIGSWWLRKAKRDGTLTDRTLWEKVLAERPEEVKRRDQRQEEEEGGDPEAVGRDKLEETGPPASMSTEERLRKEEEELRRLRQVHEDEILARRISCQLIRSVQDLSWSGKAKKSRLRSKH